jgi:iron complex outermembrane recepter protein
VTLDLYRIDIDDRIIFSSNIQPEPAASCGTPFNAARCPIRAILDPLAVGQLLLFTNAIDTETTDADLVVLYDRPLAGDSLLSLEGAFHFNDTEVTARRSPSRILPAEVLFDQSQITLIEEGQPGEHFVLSGTYYRGPFTGNLRFNYFGEVAGEGFTPGFKQTWDGATLFDAAVGVNISEKLRISVGGNNILDTYPDKWDPVNAFPFPQLGFTYGWETLPFGINGAYYYAKVDWRF